MRLLRMKNGLARSWGPARPTFLDKDKTTTGDKAGRRSHLHAPPTDEDEDTFNACGI
jgi:hypothetical protein